MKRIAIFCDGTWNRAYAPNPTNVVQLAQAVRLTADDGITQQVFYIMGVGTGRGSNWVGRSLDRVTGGIMGWGLLENIEDIYRSLVFCYEPGDEIYIFGFSRGAYTARSLAGLIRSCGIPPRENVHRIPEAIARYRSTDAETHPRHVNSYQWRSVFAPFTTTSEAEFEWRMTHRPGLCEVLKIQHMGIWDTVGALGVPGFLMAAPLLNKSHQFHDAELSSSVVSARHAVAIDEHRKTFPSSPWNNMDHLNKVRLGVETLDDTPREKWPYRQEWFPGDHGSIGGGGDIDGLSSFTLQWIAEGAAKAGLSLRENQLKRAYTGQDIDVALMNKRHAGLANSLMRMTIAHREGPSDVRHVSTTAARRVQEVPSYRPKVLNKVLDALLDQ